MSNEIQVLPKEGRANITILGKNAGTDGKRFRLELLWDVINGVADLDLAVVTLKAGKAQNLVYYANKKAPGLQLSEDNLTGAGDGADEWVNIDTQALPADIDGLVIAVVVYSGKDFASVANPEIRGFAGMDETAPQIFNFKLNESAFDGDTIYLGGRLKKNGENWFFEATGKFLAKGKGTAAFNALKDLDFTV